MCFTVTLRSLIIATLWGTGIVLALVTAIYPLQLGALSMAFMVTAATLTIRGCIDKYAASWETAYEVGREVAKVRQMR